MRALSECLRRVLRANAFDRGQGSVRARDRHSRFPVQNTGQKCIAHALHDAVSQPSISIAVSIFSALRDTQRLTDTPPHLQSP